MEYGIHATLSALIYCWNLLADQFPDIALAILLNNTDGHPISYYGYVLLIISRDDVCYYLIKIFNLLSKYRTKLNSVIVIFTVSSIQTACVFTFHISIIDTNFG